MEIELRRDLITPRGTLGKMYVDGVYQCETLEDPVREVLGQPVASWKVDGVTAIPAGHYRIIINHSQRFNRDMPLLLNVPGFNGIRIHSGNTSADTEGCVLVGLERGKPPAISILESRIAFNELFEVMQEEFNMGGQVWITIGGEQA